MRSSPHFFSLSPNLVWLCYIPSTISTCLGASQSPLLPKCLHLQKSDTKLGTHEPVPFPSRPGLPASVFMAGCHCYLACSLEMEPFSASSICHSQYPYLLGSSSYIHPPGALFLSKPPPAALSKSLPSSTNCYTQPLAASPVLSCVTLIQSFQCEMAVLYFRPFPEP